MNSVINEISAEPRPIGGRDGGPGKDAPALAGAISRAVESLLSAQQPDGHWVFELEADVTIPAEYILLQHYLDRLDPELQAKIAQFIRAQQGEDGGWPLFTAVRSTSAARSRPISR